jgi:hypothetical protein
VGGGADIDAAILIDHSGSMGEVCSGHGRRLSKHQALLWGLEGLSRQIRAADRVEMWEFDNTPNRVAQARGQEAFLGALKKLSGPAGGTEIGAALDQLIRSSRAPDILVVTDGKSHALDVHALASKGRRISIVLIGEDSLEANVGHLAALTGGEIYVAAGEDLTAALRAAVRSLRASPSSVRKVDAISGRPKEVSVTRAGMRTSARWCEKTSDIAAVQGVAVLAASLALPGISAELAAEMAEAEGLITHLTSLILVDEDGTQQAGFPATRKIVLPSPRTSTRSLLACIARAEDFEPHSFIVPADCERLVQDLGKLAQRKMGRLSGIAAQLDWNEPGSLRAGDLTALDPLIAECIRATAVDPDVAALAKMLGIDPIVVVIGVIARSFAQEHRSAARIARAIFHGRAKHEVDRLVRSLCRP